MRRRPEGPAREGTTLAELLDYLKKSVEAEASDIFIVAGGPVSVKCRGRIVPLGDEKVLPKETERLISGLYELAGRSMVRFRASGDDDFPFAVPGLARFRACTYRQRGSLAAVVRVVAFAIPDWKKFHIPEKVMALAEETRGLVVFTGLARSGKSTTQACVIDRINRTREAHIITLEDPIEYLHRNQKSIVSQREIAIDTADYPAALRASLRQAPDVLLVGELRDQETIRVAMTAAEAGHLVLASLHTSGAVQAVDRILDAFPANQQSQARAQLANTLLAVVSQQMLTDSRDRMLPIFEMLWVDRKAHGLIREGRTDQIGCGDSPRGLSVDRSLLDLYGQGLISRETALEYASDPAALARMKEI